MAKNLPPPPDTPPLTTRQRALLNDLKRSSSDVSEQLALLPSLAPRHAVSEADVRTVRARILEGHTRECDG